MGNFEEVTKQKKMEGGRSWAHAEHREGENVRANGGSFLQARSKTAGELSEETIGYPKRED